MKLKTHIPNNTFAGTTPTMLVSEMNNQVGSDMQGKNPDCIGKRSITNFTSHTPCHPSSKNAANNIFLVNGTGCFSFLLKPTSVERDYLTNQSKTNQKDSLCDGETLPVNIFLLSNFYNALKSSAVLRKYFSFGKIKCRLFQSTQSFNQTILKYYNYQNTEKYLPVE